MPFRLILFLALMVIAVGSITAVVLFAKDSSSRVGAAVVGFGALVLALILCLTIVPARAVGVQVAFGKTQDTVGPGLHLIAPWSRVEKFPATIQTTRLNGNGDSEEADGPCVTVRLGNQTTACVNVTAQWQVDTQANEAVQSLYTRWRSFENIEPSLFRPQLQHALLPPFEAYNPLAQVNEEGAVTPIADLEQATKIKLEEALGDGINLTQLTINLVNYDPTTQDKLNSYSQAIADTRIAEQRKETADAQRQANDALAGSGASSNPGVLIQNCIDMTERLSKEGKGLPAAWNCSIPPESVVNVR